MKLSFEQIQFLKLIKRSPEKIAGFRSVSETLWSLVCKYAETIPDLVELRHETKEIRLKPDAEILLKYL